jgi:hypothetical protein
MKKETYQAIYACLLNIHTGKYLYLHTVISQLKIVPMHAVYSFTLITRIVCVTPVGWMDNSEYSDDDTSQELSLDAHQPVVVEKRAVESTRTHYRAQKLVKNCAREKQETTTMRMIRIWTMNVVIHKIRNKASKKGCTKAQEKAKKENQGRQQCGAVTESYNVRDGQHSCV